MRAPRERLATAAGASLGALSRALGKGSGSVIGGHAILALEPRALVRFSLGRKAALVSGTNGKSTTTKLLAKALEAMLGEEVATNAAGANLPTGLAVTLALARPGAPTVLEVDEAWLARVALEVRPAALALLNLSRDQLDRNNEVRQVAERWRQATCELGASATVVANADDPLVVWASMSAPRALWVGAGLGWRGDATGCPRCGGQISFFDKGGWQCRSCSLARPEPAAWLEPDGQGRWYARTRSSSHLLDLRLPGRANAANALMALATAHALAGEQPSFPGEALSRDDLTAKALGAMAQVQEVAGRYTTLRCAGTYARVLLAKNPAGWAEVFSMLSPAPVPVVVAVNARSADGRDPSWLWDVPFERLAGRRVVATGERCWDMAVRLHYAGVEHVTEPDLLAALAKAGPGEADVVANYTAFGQLLAASRPGVGKSLGGWCRGPQLAGPAGVPAGLRRGLAGRAGQGETGPLPARLAAGPVAPAPTPAGGPVRAMTRQPAAPITIVLVYPDLLGTYGDAGNATVLAQRLRWRGLPAEVRSVGAADALPDGCEIYLLGGGEDLPQDLAAQQLRASGALHRAVNKGAVVLAVCAGMQILGESFPARGATQPPRAEGNSENDSTQSQGLGLLPCVTYRTRAPRAVGEVLVRARGRWSGLGLISGFENHASVTELLPGAEAAGDVLVGTGNKDGSCEGVVYGHIWGTYLHGPVLARNPRLADLLLSWVVGELSPLDDAEPEALHAQRCSLGPHVRQLGAAGWRRPWERLVR